MKTLSQNLKVTAFLAVTMLSSNVTRIEAALPHAVDGNALPSLAPMVERIQDAVVNISTETEIRSRRNRSNFADPFFQRFFSQRTLPQTMRKQRGLGSGVIFSAVEGLILTNAHVIEGADRITVSLSDGRTAEARIVGLDKDSDVAVVQVNMEKLNEIPLGDSDRLRVGDFVVAIGNPFGLSQTVTSGIVSALGRTGLSIENYEDFIQTDASINPGNSGGALVNLRGELIGINTAIVAPSGGNVGIGFSIPINMALQIKDQLVAHGEVQRGRLGVNVQNLDDSLRSALNVSQKSGVLVTAVGDGSTAEQAGVRPGDLLIGANGKRIRQRTDLRNIIGLLRVGDPLKLQLVRAGETLSIDTSIGQVHVDYHIGENLSPRLRGAIFSEIEDLELRELIGDGVVVKQVKRGSAAWSSGLRTSDIIVAANRKELKNLSSFKMALNDEQVILLNVIRNNGALVLLLR